MSFTAEAQPHQNGSVAAEPLTCLPGPFGDAGRLLEKVGDGGLSDCQVVGPVRLRGGSESMKSMEPQGNMSLLCSNRLVTGSTKPPHPPPLAGRTVETWHSWSFITVIHQTSISD